MGGASSYTPEIVAGLIDRRGQLHIDQLVLMDPATERLQFIVGVCERLQRDSAPVTEIRATSDPDEAIQDADFVILQFRVGGLAARVRDETLPMELGMVGNETTGAGGFVCGLRSVPAALEIARRCERLAPHAWLLNLSNPAGIVTEALLKHSRVRTVGFCNIPINTTYGLAEVLGADPSKIQLDSFGLNHLTWVREVFLDGEPVLQGLIKAADTIQSPLYQRGLVDTMIEPTWLQAWRMLPNWYLRYYYFPERVLEDDLRKGQTRGQEDMGSEQRLHEIYSTVGYGEAARRILQKKGGAQYYLPVLQLIEAMTSDQEEIIVVNVRNDGAIPDLPAQVSVEVPARVRRDSVEALAVGPLPLRVRGLVQAVKAYEELTVEAAVKGDRETAVEALVTHPLVGSYPKATAFFDRVLENERAHLPAFLVGR